MRIETKAENRKKMAEELSRHLGCEMQYAGAPSFAYRVGSLIVNRDGTITSDKDDGEDDIRSFLIEKGYAEEVPMELNVTIPAAELSARGVRNLVNMLYSRAYLLNKSLGGEHFAVSSELIKELNENPEEEKEGLVGKITGSVGLTGLAITEDEITFTFPMAEEAERNAAYTELASLMVKKAAESNRIAAKEHTPENEKYYFRTFLIQLGFGGAENKTSRHELLKNLKGHAAFSTDEAMEKFKAEMKEKRKARKEAGDDK